MARKSYRKTDKEEKKDKKYYGRGRDKERDDDREDGREERGSRRGKKGSKKDNNFKSITYLFESKKGGSFTATVTEEMLEKFSKMEEGDRIGVTDKGEIETRYGETNAFSLWYVVANDEEED
jgi:hypothetical protein